MAKTLRQKISKQPTNTWKDGQHHQLSRKCELPQAQHFTQATMAKIEKTENKNFGDVIPRGTKIYICTKTST